MTFSRSSATVFSLLSLVLFLGALGVRLWATEQASKHIGPDHIAVLGEHVIVHINGELLTLSRQGEVQHRQKVSALGLNDSPIDLRALSDGRLLVAGQQPAVILNCDPAGWQCNKAPLSSPDGIHQQLKVLVNGDQEFFISDFKGRTVWRQSMAGGDARRVVGRDDLKGPNDIVSDRQGRLWVADSAGARLIRFDQGADGSYKPAATVSARHEYHRGQCTWPMMLAVSEDETLWVVQPDGMSENADLIVYHPELGAQSRIALPEPSYPTDIARLGTAMLVTDMDHFRIHRVDTTSHAVSDFGDDRFRAEMRQGAESRTRFRFYSDGALGGTILFAVLMVGFAFVATPKDKRWSTPAGMAPPLAASSTAPPKLTHVHWLVRNAGAERQIRILLYASYAVPLLMIVPLYMLMTQFSVPSPGQSSAEAMVAYEKLKGFGLLMLVTVLGLPAMISQTVKSLKAQLGSDGCRLYVKASDGKEQSFDPAELVYTHRVIACRDLEFAVQTGKGQPLYADREVETYLSPLLSQARKLGTFEMLRYQLAHRNRTAVISVAFLALIVILLVATGMWKQLFLPRS